MKFEVFDKLLDAVLVVDQDKSIVYSNEAFATMIGVSLKRLKVGKKGHEFIEFQDKDIFLMPNGSWGKDVATLYKEFKFETKKGNKGEASVAVIPVTGDQETPVWVHFMRDMTLEIQLQKKYRAELEQKEDVIEDLKKAQAELQKYSKNLEHMVEERTEELRKANTFVETMINSLGQGLLVFNKNNECLPRFTKACIDLFPIKPALKTKVWDILNLDEKKTKSFIKWSESIFSEILPFEDMAGLGPSFVEGPEQKYVSLEYYPFREDDGSLAGIVTVATDKTKEQQATREAQRQQEYANMIVKLVKNKNQFLTFVSDGRRMIDFLLEITSTHTTDQKANEERVHLSEILLLLHSIKGGAGVYSITKIFELAHEIESSLEPFKKLDKSEFLKYLPKFHEDIVKLHTILENYFKEYRAFLGDAIVDGESRIELKLKDLESFAGKMLEHHDPFELTQTFEENFIKQPAFELLSNYSDRVIELAQQNGKKMHPIQFEGKEVKVKGDYFGELFTNLVHAFSNVVIHGLESPEERMQNGKDEFGQIKVIFFPYLNQDKKWMKIIIEDDGRGIDPQIIVKKLKKNGMTDEQLLNKTSLDIVQHIFDDSFSTAETVTNLAGRGVGMSAIKASVEHLNGNLVMETLPGLGCKLIIDVPDFN
jgi:two-component system chemotaxis sensor kinase CheA